MTAPEQPRCLCDGGFYEVKKHPFIVSPDCPIHGTKAQTVPEPQAMTLQEAMADFEGSGLLLRRVGKLTQHGTAPWWQAGRFETLGEFRLHAEGATWSEVYRAALGVPVVERDDRAELIEALAYFVEWRDEIQADLGVHTSKQQVREAFERAEAALAKGRKS